VQAVEPIKMTHNMGILHVKLYAMVLVGSARKCSMVETKESPHFAEFMPPDSVISAHEILIAS